MPAAHASAPLDAYFGDTKEVPPVWPDPEGKVRGESFSPLYRSAPEATRKKTSNYIGYWLSWMPYVVDGRGQAGRVRSWGKRVRSGLALRHHSAIFLYGTSSARRAALAGGLEHVASREHRERASGGQALYSRICDSGAPL